jgi:hypothetical protein
MACRGTALLFYFMENVKDLFLCCFQLHYVRLVVCGLLSYYEVGIHCCQPNIIETKTLTKTGTEGNESENWHKSGFHTFTSNSL